MPLKYFHVLFVSLALMLVFGFSAWCFAQGNLGLGYGAIAAGILLLVYGIWFVSKIKTLSFALVALALAPGSLYACSACMSNPDSSAAQGLRAAMFTLFGFIVTVLLCFAAFFVYLVKRANIDSSAKGVNHA